MSVLERHVSVSMIRENLANIPQFRLPSGFTVRWFREGDMALWLQIHRFLIDNQGRAIGTATAWFDDNYNGRRYGRVHWVAIVPDMQGKGLAKPLMTIICNCLRELGHDRAYLTTSTKRFPAINLYYQFGFVPEIKDSQDRAVWDELELKLRIVRLIRG
jgi:GNAT superfamily N-acetyltransferase